MKVYNSSGQLKTIQTSDDVVFQVDGTTQNAGAPTFDFDGTDFTVSESPSDSFDITIAPERIQDLVGAMVTGNTETGITVTYEDGDGTLDFVIDIVGDTTPQLGGNLDTNSFNILFDDAHGILDDSSNEHILFQKSTTAVNYLDITNGATGSGPTIRAAGSDTNITLKIGGQGTSGVTFLGSSTASGRYALREDTDNGTNSIIFAAPAAVTTTTTFTYPDGDGSAGQVLETDASGNLSWATKLSASSTATLTNKTFDANGTGNSLSNVDVADLANGTDGELITWGADAAPTTVAAGTSGQVLTSNGAGAAPTFQAGGGGTDNVTAQATDTTDQTISTGTVTTVNWGAEDWDDDTIHDISTNNSRLTATTGGNYFIWANIVWGSNDTGNRQIIIRLNGTTQIGTILWDNSGGGEDQTMYVMAAALSATDYIECRVWQASGGNLVVQRDQSAFGMMLMS